MKHLNKILFFIFLLFISSAFNAFSQDEGNLKNTKSDPNTPIFEIKNDLGQTVFAVYPGGVKIFVDDQQLKATGGGFTVGRIGTEKVTGNEIFSVNPNDVRVYIDETTGLKATGGGFTVGRIGTEKATANDYFSVQPNDVRVILNDATGLKATGGGFTVGRIGTEKAADGEENFLSVTPDSTRVHVSETSTSGFAVGKLGVEGTSNFLDLTQDNYFIGHDVATNISTGKLNSVFGYQAGYSLTTGSDNIFIGNRAGYSTGASFTGGNENIFIGNEAGYNTTTPVRNVFIGHEAGRENVIGQYNTYVGNQAGRNGKGYYNTILGGLAASTNDFGNSNVIIGYVAGNQMVSARNVMIGQGAGYNNSSTEGGNVLIGAYAGERLADRNNILAIDTRIGNNTIHSPLIYGEFDNKGVAINDNNLYGNTFWVNGTAGGISDWTIDSDKRLKKEITTIPNALEKVMSLRGVNFYWKDSKKRGEELQMGFIAQEFKLIIPEVVKKNSEYYSMQYAPITAVLVEAVKEQQKIIENLESRLIELEKKNETLNAEVIDFQYLRSEMNELKTLVKELVGTKQESTKESAQ